MIKGEIFKPPRDETPDLSLGDGVLGRAVPVLRRVVSLVFVEKGPGDPNQTWFWPTKQVNHPWPLSPLPTHRVRSPEFWGRARMGGPEQGGV